jgi:hypothetical protein
VALLVSLLALSWFWMQAVHELGHVLGAWLTDGTVEQVVLHPLTISRTDVGRNPRPLLVAWAGPIVGVLAPLGVWALFLANRIPLAWLARFFAGFCCLANGLYLGVGSFDRVGDAGDILHHGSPMWALWLFGLVAAPAGLALWNGLEAKFGWGRSSEPVGWRLVLACAGLLLTTIILESLLSSR